MQPPSRDMHLRASTDCIARDLSGEIVLLNLRNGTYYGLETTGVLIWDKLNGGTDLDTLVTMLHERSGEDVARIEADVLAFLTDLLEHGLVDVDTRGQA